MVGSEKMSIVLVACTWLCQIDGARAHGAPLGGGRVTWVALLVASENGTGQVIGGFSILVGFAWAS